MEKNNLPSKIFFGTGLSSAKSYDELLNLIKVALESGIRCFDTAPSYGTEDILGNIFEKIFLEGQFSREDIFIQTKIDAWQMQSGNIKEHVNNALKKLKVEYIDSLLIHWPVVEYFEKTWKDFCELKKSGIVKNIGICNLRIWNLEDLSNYDTTPDIIQIEKNPLRTCEKETAFCQSHNWILQSYSPLCKMHPELRESKTLQDLANKYNKNIGQIILRWHIDTGTIPIFTSKNPKRISENSDIFDFELSKEDIMLISQHNKNYKMYLEASVCPGL